jgi:hypothetical protein
VKTDSRFSVLLAISGERLPRTEPVLVRIFS